jgi:hypothetical protein
LFRARRGTLPAPNRIENEYCAMSDRCPNCDTALVGDFCHACGQRRIAERLTVRDFLDDVRRRVFRFDVAFVRTFWRMLREPGALVDDYLEGRRGRLLDPLHFFVSSVFVQVIIVVITRAAAPLLGRTSALGWLQQIGGIVAVKILVIFWMASIWHLLFRPVRYNLAEIYVFATYVFGTTGVLWAAVPLVDLIVPLPLGANSLVVVAVTLGIELVYTSYAVQRFARLSMWVSILRVGVVLALGYGVLVALAGIDGAIELLLPPMPMRT